MTMKISGAPVGKNRAVLVDVPVITTVQYTAGDALGGKQSLAEAVAKGQFTGVIDSITITDLAKQSLAIDVFFFDRDFTPTTDNAAFDPADADLPNCIGVVSIVAGDYAACADSSVACKRDINLPFKLDADGTTLYAQAVTRGTPTYAIGDLTFKYGVTQD